MYLVVINQYQTSGSFATGSQTSVQEFQKKTELEQWLRSNANSKTGRSIRVFEANEFNFQLSVELSPKSQPEHLSKL